ncbi:Cyclin-U1-1 [Yarrowia sp. B02]|nr:Cyclin-U1-1 [Yarrowia sp. B02]
MDIEQLDAQDALQGLATQLQNLLDLAGHVSRRYEHEIAREHARLERKRKTEEDTETVQAKKQEAFSNSYGDEGHPEIAFENMNARSAILEVDLGDIPAPQEVSPEVHEQPSPRATAYLNIARAISDMIEMQAEVARPKKTPTSHLMADSLTRTSSTTSLTTLLTTRGENDEPSVVQAQKLSIAKRFFLKNPPPLTIEQYLHRIHKYCPLSSSTYMAAGHYIYKICIKHHSVPFIPENAHRMVLAALRIACKVIEDLTYPHKRFSMAGGVSKADLFKLEIAFLFLIDFDIKIDAPVLNRHMQKLEFIQRARDQMEADGVA